ncbi:MAG TPA: hypothetical protein VK021_05040 [Flavobacteriaceae bacterium]|nr:hypothetical protein [Flavobacteriaceae bacterium]
MPAQYKHSVRQWWLSVLVGIIYLIIGGWVFFSSGKIYLELTEVFVIGFGIVGFLGVFYALSNRKRLEHWGWVLMTGLIDLFIVFVLLIIPEFDESILRIYVGFILMFRSFIGVGFSVYLAHYKVRNWGIVLTLSIIGVFFSLMMIWNPPYTKLTLTLSTTIALLTVGFAQIGIAYELRRYENLFGFYKD